MANYYADSSVLVKRHVQESGTAWVQTICEPQAGNVLITARISLIEVYSAFNRRRREANIAPPAYQDILTDFETCCQFEYQLLELTPPIVQTAKELLERHPLRAYDAVQLASAMVGNTVLISIEQAPLIFLTADMRLLTAAQSQGLQIDNPNNYP
jgi:predicted nucleic acid-binding protein